jgi:hypothetical protein
MCPLTLGIRGLDVVSFLTDVIPSGADGAS